MNCRPLIALLLVGNLFGAEVASANRPSKNRWWLSVAALAAAAAADMHSSWGGRELNPMLRSPDGRFGGRGVVIKASVLGGFGGFQWALIRRKPAAAGVLSGTNGGLAAVTVGMAVRNWRC